MSSVLSVKVGVIGLLHWRGVPVVTVSITKIERVMWFLIHDEEPPDSLGQKLCVSLAVCGLVLIQENNPSNFVFVVI